MVKPGLRSASTSGGVGEAVASISIVCRMIFEKTSSSCGVGAMLDGCYPAQVPEEPLVESLSVGMLKSL